jgi:hypothetical protein
VREFVALLTRHQTMIDPTVATLNSSRSTLGLEPFVMRGPEVKVVRESDPPH